MSDQNYEKLGVTKTLHSMKFRMRNHLLQQYSGDPKRLELLRLLDAILMERLRMRQDGKIRCRKVSGLQSALPTGS